MTEATRKHEVLAGLGKRAAESQPDHIQLIATTSFRWMNPDAIANHARSLQTAGFQDAGVYKIDVLPVALRFLINEAEREYAVIYEHPRAGIWINIVTLYEDGTSLTLTNTQDRGLEKRPGHPIVYANRASGAELHAVAITHARPVKERKQLTAPSIVIEFEKAWADSVAWRKRRGISES